jgi:hypothetical protein
VALLETFMSTRSCACGPQAFIPPAAPCAENRSLRLANTNTNERNANPRREGQDGSVRSRYTEGLGKQQTYKGLLEYMLRKPGGLGCIEIIGSVCQEGAIGGDLAPGTPNATLWTQRKGGMPLPPFSLPSPP